ncbi:PHP domain-containing protein [Halobaculum limi]|uniref:PHP domain-containing protein n=1 Tax=Halobaculum limi TaxID=3031916 RepID=UPI0024075AFE|nr:PHP domain-containing protein [Halobaculum sp. YSMS11]
MHDYHAHSVYSDGSNLRRMLDAATEAGLDGVGFADHCTLTRDPQWRRQRNRYARNFDRTYDRRRAVLSSLRADYDVDIYDAVEVDYEPGLEERIRSFLDEAGFDYALGSVHYVGEYSVFSFQDFSTPDTPSPEVMVADYYETVASLVESELFNVAAHVDVVEAHPQLTGLRTPDQIERVADAFTRSRTIPEVNAKRVGRSGGPDFHPSGDLLDALVDRGVPFTLGTDAHDPSEYDVRSNALSRFCAAHDLEVVSPFDVPPRRQSADERPQAAE